MFRKVLATFVLLLALPIAASAQVSEAGKPTKNITDAGFVGTQVWHSDTVYILRDGVILDSGEVVIIQPGTIIKGDTGSLANGKYLMIGRGAKIYAEGTPTCPIIFTSILDDVDDPFDLPLDATSRELWGSLVIAGYATINIPGGTDDIEGIPPGPRTIYGGTDDNDNSGVVRYVSLRHGGINLSAANEINGLTLGGVGSGTRIDHIEVFLNADDGVEFFGGTVNVNYFASIFNDDDDFDSDQGYRGSAQFFFALKHPDFGNSFIEQDGVDVNQTDLPHARPYLGNATFIGSGLVGTAPLQAMIIRENTGGAFINNVTAEQKNVSLVTIQSQTAGTHSSLNNYMVPDGIAGDPWVGQGPFVDTLFIRSNTFWRSNVPADTHSLTAAFDTKMRSENSVNVDPGIIAIDRTQSASLNPIASTAGASVSYASFDPDNWFVDVPYRGAFDPGADNWMCGWTFTAWGEILAPCTPPTDWSCVTEAGKPLDTLLDATFTGTRYLHSDTVYVIGDGVILDSGEVIIVAPGTIVKGDIGALAAGKYLLVGPGAKGYFNGCPDCPIVMTSVLDNVDNPFDLPVDATARELWGGLVLLGRATINIPGGTDDIEGIPPGPRTIYGGSDDNDNSGSYRYISLRHGGINLSAANEINGLTMGGVGRGTRIDNIEVYLNADDGFEFFGGTVNTKYLVSLMNDDDDFDTDQGYRGSCQYFLAVRSTDFGDELAEQDGVDVNLTDLPKARPYVANATLVGPTSVGLAGSSIEMRENTGGAWFNSLMTEFKGTNPVRLDTLPTQSAMNNYIPEGNAQDPIIGTAPWEPLAIRNNRFFRFNGGTAAFSGRMTAKVSAENGVNKSPFLGNVPGVTRLLQDNNVDPRPRQFSLGTNPVWTGGIVNPSDPDNWLDDVSYQGAIAGNTPLDSAWFYDWSFFASGQFYGNNYAPKCCERRGDVNNNGNLNVLDLNFLVAYFFAGGTAPSCLPTADANGNNAVNVLDLNYLVAYFFSGGPAPVDCD